MKAFALALMVAVLAVAVDDEPAQQRRKIYSNSYLGKEPPALTAPAKDWINAKEPPVLAKLKGRVVWLEFSFIH